MKYKYGVKTQMNYAKRYIVDIQAKKYLYIQIQHQDREKHQQVEGLIYPF